MGRSGFPWLAAGLRGRPQRLRLLAPGVRWWTSMARVLVIDDESQMRQLLCEALERRGDTVDQAANGREALQRLAECQPDLVITDLVMPEMEGIETIQALRRKCPGIPIIAISGGGRVNPEGYLSMAGQIGANRTLAKPFQLKEILAAVRELTEKSS
jgi:CheY-like chemotaxis protein